METTENMEKKNEVASLESENEPTLCINSFKNCFSTEDNGSKFKLISDFIDAAEKFNRKECERDVVSEYLHESDCEEYFKILPTISEYQPGQIVSIFSVGTCILTRIAIDFKHLSKLADEVVTQILKCASKINHLIKSDKLSQVKMILNLIGSMISQGPATALRVFNQLNLSGHIYCTLFSQSNPNSSEDVRSLIIKVVSLLLSVADNVLMQQIVRAEDYLQAIFPNLKYDSASVILLILETLSSTIVNNLYVTKTKKLLLFNSNALKHIIPLYTWQGPQQMTKSKKRKLAEMEQPGTMDTSKEDIESVQKATHEFIISICSYKYGIIFYDPLCGTNGNHNPAITALLKLCSNPYADKNLSQLVVTVLKFCPDQIFHYLPELKNSFIPRPSTAWFQAMIMLDEILKQTDVISLLFETQKKLAVNQLLSIAKVLCKPQLITLDTFTESLKEGNEYVCHFLLKYLCKILKQIKIIRDYCYAKEKTSYTSLELKNFFADFISSVKKEVPHFILLENHWVDILSKDKDAFLPVPEHKVSVTRFEVLSNILENLCLYQKLHIESTTIVDASMLKGLDTFSSCLSAGELQTIKLQLFDYIVHGINFKAIDKTLSISLLPILLEVSILPDDAKTLSNAKEKVEIYFKSLTPYNGPSWELHLWLDKLSESKIRHQQELMEFLKNVFQRLVESDEEHKKDDVTALDEEITETEERKMNCSSNLVSEAIRCLDNCDDKHICKRYVESVLNGITHRLPQPNDIYLKTKNFQHIFSEKKLVYWKFLHHFHSKTERELTPGDLQDVNDLEAFFIYFNGVSQEIRAGASFYRAVADKMNYLSQFVGRKFSRQANNAWKLCTYVQLESEQLLSNENYFSGIALYVNLLEVICLCKVRPTSEEYVIAKRKITVDILSHPTIKSIFLTLVIPFDKQNDHIQINLFSIWKFIFDAFDFLKLIEFPEEDYNSIILPFKTSAIAFYNCNIQARMADISKLKYSIFEKIVSVFSSYCTKEEVVSLLQAALSLSDDLQIKLDPNCHVINCLVKNKLFIDDYTVLSLELIKLMVSKCFSTVLKIKQRQIFKDIFAEWIEVHPLYTHSIPEDAVKQLMTCDSEVDLKILKLFISHNVSERKSVETLINLQEKNNEYLINIKIHCIKVYKKPRHLQNIGQFVHDLIVEEFITNAVECPSVFPKELPAVILVLVDKNIFDSAIVNRIMEYFVDPAACKTMHSAKICILMKIFEMLSNHKKLSNIEFHNNMLSTVFSWINLGIKIKDTEDRSSLFDAISNFALRCVENCKVKQLRGIFPSSSSAITFLVSVAEIAVSDAAICGKVFDLMSALTLKILVENGESKACLDCYKEAFSNEKVNMALEGTIPEQIKGPLVNWILMLCEAVPSAKMNSEKLDILKIYGATLCFHDQQVLCFLKKLDELHGASESSSLLLWGQNIRKSLELNNQRLSLHHQPTMHDVLQQLDRNHLEYTALNFPIHLPFEIKSVDVSALNQDSRHDVEWDKVYDPRFLLHVLCSLLSPGSFVNCHHFIASGVVEVMFASISSYDVNIRAMGYYCLSQFYSHLQSLRFNKSSIWISLLDNLRNSIKSSNEKLSFIITVFLGKVVHIFRDPQSTMYIPISKFLTMKPVFEIGQIPAFHNFFNSSEIDFRHQKDFILCLLAEGLRSGSDFHVCEKCYVFTIILLYYSSPLSTEKEKRKILQIVAAAVRNPSSARKLCQSGLLEWLGSVIKLTKKNEEAIFTAIIDVMHILVTTYLNSDSCSNVAALEFQLVHLSLLQDLRHISMSTLKKYISTLLKILNFRKSLKQNDTVNRSYIQPLQNIHIEALYECWSSKTTLPQQKLRSLFCKNKQSFEIPEYLFGDVMSLWRPIWDDLDVEAVYQSTISLFVKVLHLMMRESLINFMSKPYYDWFIGNINSDNRLGIFKTILSSNSQASFCSESLLQLCELQCIRQSSETNWLSFLPTLVEKCSSCETSENFSQLLGTFVEHCNQFMHH